MTILQGPVHPHPAHHLVLGVEGEEEERDALAGLEIAPMQGLFEAETAVLALGPVEVEAPQVGAFGGMVALEAEARFDVDETGTVAVATID